MTTRKRFVKYLVARAQETASFWREIVIAIVILLRALADCGSSGSNLSTVRSFIILRSGKGLASFDTKNRANVYRRKKIAQ